MPARTLRLGALAELVDDGAEREQALVDGLAPSLARSPSAPVLAMRSLPARSTSVSTLTHTAPPSSLSWSRLRLSTTCGLPKSDQGVFCRRS